MSIRTRTSGILVDVKPPPPTAAAAFTPASLANLLAWYKADVGVFASTDTSVPATNGSVVKLWQDQSGNAYHLNKVSANSSQIPTYKTNILNALPVVNNDATALTQVGISTSGDPVSLGGTVVSSFLVVETVAGAGRMTSMATAANGDTGTDGFTIFINGSSVVAVFNGATIAQATVSTTGAWNEIGVVFDGSSGTLFTNNSSQASGADSNTFGANVDIGMACTGGTLANAMSGSVAEAVFTKSAMSATDRNNLHTYFMNKWGV